MNKSELVASVAEVAELTKKVSELIGIFDKPSLITLFAKVEYIYNNN